MVQSGPQSHLVQYSLRTDALTDLTREARDTLRGCTPLGPDSPPPPTPPFLPSPVAPPPPPPRPPPPAPPPSHPQTLLPRAAYTVGAELAALIVGFTALLVGAGSWLRCRKRRGWSSVARVSHEEGARATRCPNGAHADEDAAALEGGVLGHRLARQKARLKKYSRFADSDESLLRPNRKATNEDSDHGFMESATQTVVAAAPDSNVECDDDQVYAL